MKKIYIFLVLIILGITLVFMRGNEDTWICENGQWVKHGNPEQSEPKTACGEPKEPVACTMDAKECPDGSYVGRSGPNCEFVCPQ